ncbi:MULTISPECIES: 2-dehydro-3-deoxygalactonokinase [Halomonadaceae]|uniref:2-dehydro-3-deoxygalactonokinase n=1 Tax=Halomonadaceae TaxID=28256 RepID=UPI001597BFA4|nr:MULTISPECIES: 2-dehydro-3-deoxygalactonokinase [Halomonas]QJQ94540.1 2-dehydro-3-deoxygalactonokinase [Halomonas sp. PA5]
MTNTAPALTADWVAVDWGSSNLRAWALDGDDRVMAERSAPRGMLSLAPAQFEAALLETIDGWLAEGRQTQVLVCGMAGARQGWVEAAYLALEGSASCALEHLAHQLTPVATRDPRLDVAIVPGLSQHDDGERRFDVMRGEETQLAGLLSRHPGLSGSVCLPGTHAKWVYLDNGRVGHFRTYLSGELYKLLSETSVLAHSVRAPAQEAADNGEACQAAYLSGIDEACRHPESLSAELFGIRARDLLDSQLPAHRRSTVLAARLSGLVLGLELAGATRELSHGEAIHLIGDEALCRRYRLALEHLGFAVHTHANAEMIVAGLARVRRHHG